MMTVTRSQDTFILTTEGKSREYPIAELSKEFVEWNLGQRMTVLQHMLENVGNAAAHHKGGGGFGSHLPVFITNNPEDKLFPLNAANKGTGFVAKEAYLDYYLEKFSTVFTKTETPDDATPEEKNNAIKTRIKTILEFYQDREKIDLRCLAGLEIWPGQTSKNVLADPRVSLHFLGMPGHGGPMHYNQFQVNCIFEKIDHSDKRFAFGVALRRLTMGHVGKSFVPGHIPTEQTPIKGTHPFGWNLWVIETIDKGIAPIHS